MPVHLQTIGLFGLGVVLIPHDNRRHLCALFAHDTRPNLLDILHYAKLCRYAIKWFLHRAETPIRAGNESLHKQLKVTSVKVQVFLVFYVDKGEVPGRAEIVLHALCEVPGCDVKWTIWKLGRWQRNHAVSFFRVSLLAEWQCRAILLVLFWVEVSECEDLLGLHDGSHIFEAPIPIAAFDSRVAINTAYYLTFET